MFGKSEDGLEACARLDRARKEYLTSLRGHSPAYDQITGAAKSAVLAMDEDCGVPKQYRQRIQELIEATLISQQKTLRAEADESERKSVDMARKSEKNLIKSRMYKLLEGL